MSCTSPANIFANVNNSEEALLLSHDEQRMNQPARQLLNMQALCWLKHGRPQAPSPPKHLPSLCSPVTRQVLLIHCKRSYANRTCRGVCVVDVGTQLHNFLAFQRPQWNLNWVKLYAR